MIRIVILPNGDIQSSPTGILSPKHAREIEAAHAKAVEHLKIRLAEETDRADRAERQLSDQSLKSRGVPR